MHLAARSNSINIARLLKHIYIESNKDDLNLEISPNENGTPSSSRSTSSSALDNMIYFDVDRTNN